MDILLYFAAIIVALVAQARVHGAYQKYKQVRTQRGYTGAQVARRILDQNGLQHVVVEQAQGTLSDHYDPRSNVVRLSTDIYNNSSIASVSVAAHEVGHAIQHKENYGFIGLRNAILPVTQIASTLAWPVILFGLLASSTGLLWTGIVMLSVVLVFQLITLPVEFNASSRAIKLLVDDGFITTDEVSESKSMLSAAAMTYVAAVVASALQILRLVLLANRRD